ncbi:PAS domain S-box protein [Pedobacter sp. KBS0701]|uniref:PAS domain-containing sensor histidine kinase n=1 Tax=Pedobacter sp. KBS0701 TaxID=2578106 RepID=UPI00110F6598|nr:PAS domain-containing protein [Pedobacter sp. KBS0701]QDW25041.1 PAS domain S-box protein [Pedobacter sp. KBS0701]
MSELSASEKRFRALVTATSDVVYRLSPDWEIMYELDGRGFLSSTSAPITGWRERNVHPYDMEMVNAAISQAIERKGIFELEHRVVRADGSLGWTVSRAVPILGDDGEIEEWFGAASDITIKKNIEEEKSRLSLDLAALNEEAAATNEELHAANDELMLSQDKLGEVNSRLEQILNMLPASVVVIRGNELLVEMINDSNLLYWNKTRKEVIGRPFLEILPDLADQPFAGQLRKVMETGQIIDVKESPVIFTSADGSLRETYVDYTYQPLRDTDGNISGVLVMSFEITDRVISRKLLEGYTAQLSNTNDQLSISNNKLYKSEQRFKFLIEEAPVAIGVLHGRELTVETANAKLLEVWGKNNAIVGFPLKDALPEINDQPFQKILEKVFDTGEAFYANEIRAMLQHGQALKEYFFNLVYQPVMDYTGKTADILVVAIDVTLQVNARKAVERSEEHFRRLADLVPAKISNALPNGEVTFFNRQWLDFAGMGFEDLRDFGYLEMLHPDEIPVFQQGLAAAAKSGVPYISEMRFKNTEGSYVWHLNVASPVMNEAGEVIMWVGSTTNIQSIKEEEQRKNDFIGMVSHELKTPLTSLNGYLQFMQRKAQKSGDDALYQGFKQPLKQVSIMTAMINGFLNVARLDAGKIPIEKSAFNMAELIQSAQDEFRALYSSHIIICPHLDEVAVLADRDKILQVLNNLVSNAAKYSAASTTIEISCQRVAHWVRVSVLDQGIGVSKEELGKLFERYYRVEKNNNIAGFGIGLYLCAEIIKIHNGKIWGESEAGQGSVFHFELPLSGFL